MEKVSLLLDGRRDAVCRPGLGFLGTAPFAYENPSFWGLVFLGFPWILSSETIDINGLHEIFARSFFLALLSPGRAVETATPRFGMRKGRIAHAASLLQFLIFCKRLPPRRRPKANRSRVFRRGVESAPLGGIAVLERAHSTGARP
jgi:hypothetical protein